MTRTHPLARVLVALLAVLALAAGLLSAAPAAQADRVRPDFFGMHDGRISAGQYPSTVVGGIRLWDTFGTTWNQIEREPGTRPSQWSWSQLDTAVRTAEANGAKPLIVLGQTPRFYSSKPKSAGNVAQGAAAMPKSLKAWTRYVGAVAKRYKLRAEYQVWNEPNIKQYFNGSPGQMAKLTQSAYKVIKRVNRKAKVVAPSMPLRLRYQRTWFSKFWSQRVGGKHIKSFADVAGVHSYPIENQAPEQGDALVSYAKRVLRKKRVKMPLWNLEINYGLRGGDAAPQISEALQAAYVGRTYILNAASGVKRAYWYRWDLQDGLANTELTQSDNTTKTTAGFAFGEVRSWLVGSTMKGCSKARSGIYTCTAVVSRTEGRKFYWKPKGDPGSVVAPRGSQQFRNLYGGQSTVSPGTRIQIGSSPIMLTYRR